MSAELASTTDLTPDAARRLTERIRIAAQNYTDAKDKVLQLVDEAKAGNAHLALGYPSWTAYLSDVLSDEPLRLARDQRPELTSKLKNEGMSNRAIGTVLGVSEATVRNDLSSPTAQKYAVERPAMVTSLDGRERPSVNTHTGEITQPEPAMSTTPTTPRNVPLDQRLASITELAGEGYTSAQIGAQIGVSDKRVRELARDNSVDIPADKVTGRMRHIDSNRVMEQTIATLEGLAMGVALIDVAELDRSQIEHWSSSLKESLKAIRTLQKELDQS